VHFVGLSVVNWLLTVHRMNNTKFTGDMNGKKLLLFYYR
jgi:hypothetical protein